MNLIHRRCFVFPGPALALLFLLPGWSFAQTTIGRIVVFGTSLSDSGNAFVLKGGENLPPYDMVGPLLIPSFPYAKGGHHYSNGATWVEQMARPLGLAGNTRPAFDVVNTDATNYAVGSARAREDGINFNLSFQVNAFLNAHGGVAPSDGLYIVECGALDVKDALEAIASGRNGGAILEEAVASIGHSIGILYAAGARRFLVWNVPDIGLTPAINMLGPAAAQLGTFLTMTFNDALDQGLGSLQGYPGIQIKKLDVFQILHEIITKPGAFDLSVIDKPCVMPNTPPFECQVPDEYLFWDGMHPTKAVHAVVAQRAAIALAIK